VCGFAGYFILDKDSYKEGRQGPVFNLTVGLKSSKAAAGGKGGKGKVGATKSRKAAQDQILKDKQAKMSLNPKEMFRGDAAYSKLDQNGVPTHDAKGAALSKSAFKKLKKEWDKQRKLFEKHNKQ